MRPGERRHSHTQFPCLKTAGYRKDIDEIGPVGPGTALVRYGGPAWIRTTDLSLIRTAL